MQISFESHRFPGYSFIYLSRSHRNRRPVLRLRDTGKYGNWALIRKSLKHIRASRRRFYKTDSCVIYKFEKFLINVPTIVKPSLCSPRRGCHSRPCSFACAAHFFFFFLFFLSPRKWRETGGERGEQERERSFASAI